jgi:hypothetical protein
VADRGALVTISVGPTEDGYSGTLAPAAGGQWVATLSAPSGGATSLSALVNLADRQAGILSYVPASCLGANPVAAVNAALLVLASTVGVWPGDRRCLEIRKRLLIAYNASIGVAVVVA